MGYWSNDWLKAKGIHVWEITEDSEEIEAQFQKFAHDSEIQDYQQLKHPNRKKEWMLVRIMLKQILGNERYIKYAENGSPYIADSNVGISISHSNDFVVLYLNQKTNIGIDVEQITERAFRLKTKFLSHNELGTLSEKAVESCCLYWSAKEVLYKIYQKKKLDFRTNLAIHKFDFQIDNTIEGVIRTDSFEQKYKLSYLNLKAQNQESYILTWNE